MVEKGMSKAGPVTLALGLIVAGIVLLLYNFGMITSLGWVWKLWPLLLIGIGLEYFLKRAFNPEGEVRFHVPSFMLILLMIITSGAAYAATNIGRNIDGFLDGMPWYDKHFTYSRSWESVPLEINAGEQLTIENNVGKVELLPARDNKLKVRAVIRAPENGSTREIAEKINPEVKRVERRVLVTVPDQQKYSGRNVATDLAVEIPAGVEVRIDSGTGRVTAENLKNNLTVNGTTGTIEVRNIGGNVEVRNNTGRVEVIEPGGDLLAETNTGSLEVTSGRPLTGKYQLKSNTGRVSLELPKESDLFINAQSRTGRVSVNGLRDNRETRNPRGPSDQFNYKLGAGKGQADIQVGTGAISIMVR